MNLYFLVEGKRTEVKVYPKWLGYLLPAFKRVKYPNEAVENNYFLISGNGYPCILNQIITSIEEINELGNYNHLIVCLDAEENTVEEHINSIINKIQNENIALKNCNLIIIVQNRCFETWFLGNKKVYPRNPQNQDLIKYTRYYNVSIQDPEKMGKHNFNTHAAFHKEYLKKILSEKKLVYTKKSPGVVCEEHYLNQLIVRINNDIEHLKTFREFYEFCCKIKKNIPPKFN